MTNESQPAKELKRTCRECGEPINSDNYLRLYCDKCRAAISQRSTAPHPEPPQKSGI